MPDDRRRLPLRSALGLLQLPPRAPELRLLHRWLDTWAGLGLVVAGVATRSIRFPHRGHASTSMSKDHLSYCTSCKGVVRGTQRGAFARRPAVGWTLLLGSVQPLAHLVADPRLEASLATPPPDGGPTDAELSGDLRAGEHAGGQQALREARETR